MNDQTAQNPQTNVSYVDDYVPPTDDANLTTVPLDDSATTSPVVPPVSQDSSVVNSTDDSSDDIDLEETLAGTDENSEGMDISDEDIEAQNIFEMLGVEGGNEDLKEKFLDQLQDVIWDDFLANDVQLLLSESENTEFQTYKSKADSAAEGDAKEQAKDEMVEYLEKLVPDLEDIMLEKALDLKADLFVERINGLKEYFTEKPDQLAKVNEAEQMMFEDKWKSAAELLNSLTD